MGRDVTISPTYEVYLTVTFVVDMTLTFSAPKRFQLLSPWSPDQIVEKFEYMMLVQLN